MNNIDKVVEIKLRNLPELEKFFLLTNIRKDIADSLAPGAGKCSYLLKTNLFLFPIYHFLFSSLHFCTVF